MCIISEIDQNAWAGSVDATEEVRFELSARLEFLMPAITRAVAECAAVPPRAGAGAGGAGRKEVTPGCALGCDADMWTLGGH